MGRSKSKIGDVDIGIDIGPEQGAADSGDLEVDLPSLFVAVGEAGKERNVAVAQLIDQIQYFNSPELSALVIVMHKMQQRQSPVARVPADLPIRSRLVGESKS